MSNREIFSSRKQAEEEEKLIEEVCKFRRQGYNSKEIYRRVSVGCTAGKVATLTDKYDFLCQWLQRVREMFVDEQAEIVKESESYEVEQL